MTSCLLRYTTRRATVTYAGAQPSFLCLCAYKWWYNIIQLKISLYFSPTDTWKFGVRKNVFWNNYMIYGIMTSGHRIMPMLKTLDTAAEHERMHHHEQMSHVRECWDFERKIGATDFGWLKRNKILAFTPKVNALSVLWSSFVLLLLQTE